MSSPEPRRHTQQHRRLPTPATPAACGDATAGALPSDALCEIQLRLPGKQLCRLRTVCRAWRSLLSAPWFAAAHAARYPEPYIVASYADDVDLDRDSLADVLDMSSGRIVRHVAAGNASDMVVSVAAATVTTCLRSAPSAAVHGGGECRDLRGLSCGMNGPGWSSAGWSTA
ncbi:uncharacterized protein [Miscanthus floridulus]|uniref:uncharacterized protein isoform X1 n=1 Tax=Miscanthus floridulus TaxID=154761 RepID=UPI00345B446E